MEKEMKRKSSLNTDARKEKDGKALGNNNTTVCEDKQIQLELEASSLELRSESYYGPEEEKRTCISSCGDPFSWTQKTTGISWIGVNGTESAYVVAMNDVPLDTPGRTQLGVWGVVGVALCDIGVWADTSTEYTEFRRQMIAQRSSDKVGPFAVVSEAPGTKDHLASRAINFLAEELKNRSALNHGEVKQIAICALKFLLGPKFDAKKIEIMGSGKGSRYDVMMNAFEVETAIGILNAQPFGYCSTPGQATPAPAFANNSPFFTPTPQQFGAPQSAAFGSGTTNFDVSIPPTEEEDTLIKTTIIGICVNGYLIMGGDTKTTRSEGTIEPNNYRKVHVLHDCGLYFALAGNSKVGGDIVTWFRRTYLGRTPRTVTEVAQHIISIVQDVKFTHTSEIDFIVGGHSIEEKFKMVSIKKIPGKSPVIDMDCKFCAIGSGAKFVPSIEDRHTTSISSAILFTLYGLQLASMYDSYTGGYLVVRGIGENEVQIRTSKPTDGGEDGDYNHVFKDVTLSFVEDRLSKI